MRQTLSDYDDRDEGYTLLSEARQPEAAPPPPPPDRRLPKLILSAGAMAVFAGGLWFAYVQGTHHLSAGSAVAQSDGGVPILRADPQPTKVKPDQPGGMNVPDQNVSLYNDKPGAAPVEKLLPGPEKVMPRPAPPPPPPAAAQSVPALAPVVTQAAPAKPADKAGAITKSKPATVEKQAALEKPIAEAKPLAAKQPVAAPPKAEAAPAAKSNGPIQLRLASMRTPEAAKEEWAKLKRENSDILGTLRAVAVRTDLGDKGVYYRIEAGPFADTVAAEKICSEMKRRNLGCILAR